MALGAGITGLLWSLAIATPVVAADEDVEIAGFAYAPRTVTIEVGDSVTWTNADAQGHTASADDGSFDTSSIANGASESIAFTAAGEYAYHCEFHPDMAGTVVVLTAGSAPPPTDTLRAPRAPAEPGVRPATLVGLGLTFLAALAITLGRPRQRG